MQNTGIICEYNPFHKGHAKQIAAVRQEFGADNGIVCLMSGNFVQRAAPAVIDKSLRAEAAIRCGADLVLELPIPYALCSAEGFASGSVSTGAASTARSTDVTNIVKTSIIASSCFHRRLLLFIVSSS